MVKKVIYIEKEKFLRQLMEAALKSKGAEIFSVETLTNNHYLIDDIQPEILIIDLESSPREEIIELINTQKAKIILTSNHDLTSEDEGIKAKIAHFLKKPLVANQIAQRILDL